jgi:hypothetical protein
MLTMNKLVDCFQDEFQNFETDEVRLLHVVLFYHIFVNFKNTQIQITQRFSLEFFFSKNQNFSSSKMIQNWIKIIFKT